MALSPHIHRRCVFESLQESLNVRRTRSQKEQAAKEARFLISFDDDYSWIHAFLSKKKSTFFIVTIPEFDAIPVLKKQNNI